MPIAEPPNLEHAVRTAIQQEVDRIVAEEAAAAAKRTEQRVREAAASISARCSQLMTFQTFGQELVIRLDTKDLKL